MDTAMDLENEADQYDMKAFSSGTRPEDSFKLITKAADLYIKSMSKITTKQDALRLKHKIETALAHAENLKAEALSQEPQDQSEGRARWVQRAPLASEPATRKEQIILLKGSKLNGFIFPPWQVIPSSDDFEPGRGGSLFLDDPPLELSEEQIDLFNGWKRIIDILGKGSPLHDENRARPILDLIQDVATDCSVVASMCAGVAQVERGFPSIIPSAIWPIGDKTQKPIVSPNGKYIFKFYFNGCTRQVVIDDRIPSTASNRHLYVVDREDSRLLWPALLEKAYLKVRGGYDFPGSNSGTDIWILSGWIPEQVYLQSDEVDPNALWDRVFPAFREGNVLFTIGTGNMSAREERVLGLAGHHDYAVLDLKQVGEHRYILIKNPWASGTVWQGTLPLNEADQSHDSSSGSPPPTLQTLTEAYSLTPGTFWMDLNNLMQNFETAYLNWQPALYPHRQDVHFSWDLFSNTEVPGCFGSNPQYVISSRQGGDILLLASRHFVSGESAILKALSAQSPQSQPQLGFLSLYVFAADGHQVLLSDNALHRGPYVDSPQTLMRLTLPPNTSYTIVLSQQFHYPLPYSFTLTAYSPTALTLNPAPAKYPFCTTHPGAWSASSAGGNAESPVYGTNPQFGLLVHQPTTLALLLESPTLNLNVHVKLVHGEGKRVSNISKKDVLGDSGEYRLNGALAELTEVPPGRYTVVCSTFATGELGEFVLRVGAMRKVDVWVLGEEGAGRLTVSRRVGLREGVVGARARVAVKRLTKVAVVVRWEAEGGVRSAVKVGIEDGGRVLGISRGGEWSDELGGVRVEDVDVGVGGGWVVIMRRGEGEERLRVEVLAEGEVDVGQWEEIEE
ncbi:MAG: cysteine protease [Vezdaea aestivalis]|nr:MAG: cysteine protease [Vezdaea aestivalis]